MGAARTDGRTGIPPADLALLLLVCLVWGLNFIPIRWALDAVPPFALAALRFLLAAVPMVFFVPRPRIPWPNLVGYGLAIGVFQFGLLFLAIKVGLAAGLASLLMQLQMFFTIGIAAVWTGDRMSRAQAVGALVSSIGVAVLAMDLLSGGAHINAWGLILVVLASLSWGFGNVLAKATARSHTFDMFGLVVWSSLVAPLPLAIASYATEGGAEPVRAILHAGWKPFLSAVFMAYAATLFGYAAWNRLLHRHSAGAVVPFTMTVPVAGLVGAALVLHESLRPVQMAGAVVLLAGIAVASLGHRVGLGRVRREAAPGAADAQA